MNGIQFASLATMLVCLCTNVAGGAETKHDRLDRLTSYGFLITPGGIGDTDTRIVVPYDSNAGKREIADLLDYCLKYSPKSEIVFFGPVIVEEQFRQFRLYLPKSLPRHMPAVGLGVIYRTTHDDRFSRVLRVDHTTKTGKTNGLRVGDVILGIGDYRWPESDSHDSFRYAMKRQLPGQRVTVLVKRDGKHVSLLVDWKESIPHRTLTRIAANNPLHTEPRTARKLKPTSSSAVR